ncbi:MAG: class I SAM-dependent methyltransferase [Candidatus Rokuibacteriota bacterium]
MPGTARGMALTPSDHGRPVPVARLERKYRRGGFRFLDSSSELGHYAIVAGYVRWLFESPAILDVGCGHGRLAALLHGGGIARYRGIDVSREAIRRARRRARGRMTFEVADFDAWEPPERYDVVVFCESLNYAAHPAYTLRRYARALAPDGALVVSLYRHRGPGAVWRRTWRNAGRYFETVDATTVSNAHGQTWDVRVLREAAFAREDR